MSRISKEVKELREENRLKPGKIVKNFMGGDSYVLTPIETLKMIAASSIFGEPSYYRDNKDSQYRKTIIREYSILPDECCGKTTTEIFTEAIDAALEYDFGATILLAVQLRNEYNMRLNPQIIMVRAAMHPSRKAWTQEHPGWFNRIQQRVMSRADEPATQIAYYLYANNGKKENMPSILKRSIAKRLANATPYEVNKYKNAEIGMINAVRIVHAKSPIIDKLMKYGTVFVPEFQKTWEQKRSAGMSWKDIYMSTPMGHMAMLRNIRNIFAEIDDMAMCGAFMEDLKSKILVTKQELFPFRYEAAYRAINAATGIHHKQMILDKLEECVDLAIGNLPHLRGRTMCLSDNSGSAWGTFNSEYGRVTVANIDNLSSVIAAKCSDEGFVGKFGDKLKIIPISKRNGTLSQTKEINAGGMTEVGGATETGIWIFFRDAIANKDWYDNIFIFSDQQAGTGGLYGDRQSLEQYSKSGFSIGCNINVFKLILEYRKKVNPKVNVFSVQTAGYNNVLIPEMSYRCAILTGWTGKEILFASEYIKQWDRIESDRAK